MPISILLLKIETTGLGPAPPIFPKLLKVSMTVTQHGHQNYNLLRLHPTDWSLFRSNVHEPRHTNLSSRFYHKLEKSVLTPVQEIEFLGLRINSVTQELSLNKAKIQKVGSECQNLLNNLQSSMLELTKWIGLLALTI